jgi:hypothetical protein
MSCDDSGSDIQPCNLTPADSLSTHLRYWKTFLKLPVRYQLIDYIR